MGWREWMALPQLGIDRIKAKVDTGARTSALHAFELEEYVEGERPMVRFAIHPLQERSDVVVRCMAERIDTRLVSDSGGHRELRPIIRTEVALGELRWSVEVTLTNRDTMKFRMLLGRTAMHGRFVVDPEASYLWGRPHG